MTKFNQAKFESEAKELVAGYLSYEIDEVDEEDVFIVWFSKVGADAKVMICDMDDHCFEVTYGEEGKYILDVYDPTGWNGFHEEELQ